MKLTNFSTQKPNGFALVVTLSLMILLTIVAVGLLGLSAVSLRSAGQSDAAARAKANARMALMLAIGDLQKSAGPDQRITATSNLANSQNPMGITGVWKAWKPDPSGTGGVDYDGHKSGDHFLGYLMSGNDFRSSPDPKSLPKGKSAAMLVGKGTLDDTSTGTVVEAPIVIAKKSSKTADSGGYAWAVFDEGAKGRIDLEPKTRSRELGQQISAMGSPARNRFKGVTGMDFLESNTDEELRKDLPKLVTLKQAQLKTTSDIKSLGNYFHDFTVSSKSLQTNVADGGLKTDLSVLFEGNYGDGVPSDYSNKYLYSNSPTPYPDGSSNSDVQWSLFANYARLYRLSGSGNGSPLTGLVAKLPSGYQLKPFVDSSANPTFTRYEARMASLKRPVLMPTILRVDTVFSAVVRQAHQGRGSAQYPYMLHLMYLPVITLHNPYNTSLRCANFQLEFSDVPIGFQFSVNGKIASTDGRFTPLNELYLGGTLKKTFSVTLSNSLTSANEVVMAPGETIIFGTPFSKDATWQSEVDANGAVMFDWKSDKTSNVKMIPGMITGPTDGIGFDIDWLVPNARAEWMKSRRDEGVILLAPTDTIQINYKPVPPLNSGNLLTITTRMAGLESGKTQIVYKNESTLTSIVSEGVSPRYTSKRTFPAVYPPGAPIVATSLLENNTTKFKDYVKAKPIAVFSIGAKTTMESFTKSRVTADTGIAYQMTTCDFRKSNSQGASPLEFALVPVTNGGSAIESDGKNGFFFGGHGSNRGSTSATIFEIPLAPLQSIAQLRHANGSSISSWPLVTYSVGESRAHPSIPSNEVKFQASSGNVNLDHSWLANSALWDGYWFSTVSSLRGSAYSGAGAMDQKELFQRFYKGEMPLPNPRNSLYVPAGKPADSSEIATAAVANDGKNTAAYVMTRGGFNVNSSSVPAWCAVLSAMADSEVPLAGGSGSVESSGDAVFPRLRRPTMGTKDMAANPRNKLWNSYRSLTSEQIKTLAERIVDEVRARGPFLSMAEFVNRRVGPPGETTAKGALQAALDRTDLNSPMLANARPVGSGEVAGYGWQNPAVIDGNTGAGCPGEISQGDLLSVIGSFATVRSDTFRIRTYGDARDAKGSIIAKAWCEATVQRIPEYVDPKDAPEATATTPGNQNFGRRFQITGFRWLTAEEI